jgi:aconitate hydratase
MGVLPLQFLPDATMATYGLTGDEVFRVSGIQNLVPRGKAMVSARRKDGKTVEFETLVRLDSPIEVEYYRHGGIMPYVLRQLARRK